MCCIGCSRVQKRTAPERRCSNPIMLAMLPSFAMLACDSLGDWKRKKADKESLPALAVGWMD